MMQLEQGASEGGLDSLRQAHGVLAAAAALTPEALQSAVRAYLAEPQESLREDVASAVAALDAHLLACHGLLLEDLPPEVLAQFCADPTVLASKERAGRIRTALYGEGRLPILLELASVKDAPATVRRRQFLVERETLNAAVRDYHAQQLQMAETGRSATSPRKVRVWLQWVDVIARRITELRQDDTPLRGRGAKGLQMVRSLGLDPELIGVVVCQTVLNLVYLPNWRLRDEAKNIDGSVPFVTAVVAVGEAVELESWIRQHGSPLLRSTSRPSARMPQARVAAMMSRRRNNTAGVWDKAKETVPIGAALIDILLEHASVQVKRDTLSPEDLERLGVDGDVPATPGSKAGLSDMVRVSAFAHSKRWEGRKQVGFLALEQHARDQMDYDADIMALIEPKHQPMLMEPLPWRPAVRMGGYLIHQVPFIRTTSPSMTCLNVYSPRRVARVMDNLGRTPWRINPRIFELMREVQRQDLAIAEVPPKEDPEVPKLPPGFADLPQEERDALFLKRHNAEQRCMELQSERPTFELKLQVARNFLNAESMYFPHNVDFRGRAYPIPPHLNHISDDICRGLLMFAESKPLGKEGFFWLKVNFANLMGKNKLSFEERIDYVNGAKEWIMDVARDPLATRNVDRWANADDGPWQALARCIDLASVWAAGDEQGFRSRLPVHLDGSCNGLQHYAALGRDEEGAKAVNLLPSDRPRDVYTVVLGVVKEKVQKDAECIEEDETSKAGKNGRMARRLIGLNALQRKVVKQTVMTICYGVTRLGAQRQVKNHLSDWVGEQVGPDELKALASYLSGLVLASIDEVFERAMQIKLWFDSISGLLNTLEQPTSWLSPIGLACAQPYRKQRSVIVQASRQRISLNHGETPKVQKLKQRMGFPPNFVHSLDATHMMMVADGCQEEGITFAGVHDSFWTHPCDAPTLNRVIRKAFVELHSQPLLEELYEDLRVRLGGRELPPLPEQGSLDLSLVHQSPYIFN